VRADGPVQKRTGLEPGAWAGGEPGVDVTSGAVWPRYPARDQDAEYLELYQEHFALRPHFGEAVDRLERVDGTWETTTSKGTWRSTNVVIATGRARVRCARHGRKWISTEVTFSTRASTATETDGKVGPFSWWVLTPSALSVESALSL
jgi:glycine/D-amino acid oxidase-like deaminating enzyme